MMNVLFSIDLSYWQYLGITLSSLLRANRNESFQVFVMATAAPSPEDAEKLAAIVNAAGNATFHVIPMKDTAALKDLPLNEHLSVATYYRLLLVQYLPSTIDRILYLDSDLLIQSSHIRELWETDLGDNYLGAVMEPYSARTREPLGFGPQDFYFNAGIMLVNLRKWREDGVTARLLTFAAENSERLPGHDQDVLNCVFRGKVTPLDLCWNWQAVFPRWLPQQLGISQKQFDRYKQNPGIIHFTGHLKPWFWRWQPHYKDLYLRAKAHTPWAATRPVDKMPRNIPVKLRRRLQQFLEWNLPGLTGGYLRARPRK